MVEKLTNDLLLRALELRPNPRPPVWVMRQAGRYLPEYMKVRKKAGSFMDLCRNPDFACEVTMQPVERFALDAAIVFSDILTIPDGLGLGLRFTDGEGPWLENPVRDENAVNALGELDLGRVDYVGEAVAACHKALAGSVPLIGFAGGPFTLACYMVEGKGGEFLHARALMHSRPDLFSSLLATNADAVAQSLLMQAEAGANVLMVFDSWAGLVPPNKAEECLAAPLRQVLSKIEEAGCDLPMIVFWRDASEHTRLAVEAGVAGLGVSWRSDMAKLSASFGRRVALQGNLDPAVLLTNEATIREEVAKVIASHASPAGHIFNLGHGISKETPPENMEILVAAVHAATGSSATR